MDRTYSGRFTGEMKVYLRAAISNTADKEAYPTRWMRSVVRKWRNPQDRARLIAEITEFDQLMTVQGVSYVFIVFPELNSVLSPDRFGYPRTALIELSGPRRDRLLRSV